MGLERRSSKGTLVQEKDDSTVGSSKRPRMDFGMHDMQAQPEGTSAAAAAGRESHFKPPPPPPAPSVSGRANPTVPKQNGNVGKNTSGSPNLRHGSVVADITDTSTGGNDFNFFNNGAEGGSGGSLFGFGAGNEEDAGSSSFFLNDDSSNAPSPF